MIPGTKLTLAHNECANEPLRPTVAAYVTVTYGDFTFVGAKIVRKGTLVYVMLPKGVSITSEYGRRQAFDEYMLKSWRSDLHQRAIEANHAHREAEHAEMLGA